MKPQHVSKGSRPHHATHMLTMVSPGTHRPCSANTGEHPHVLHKASQKITQVLPRSTALPTNHHGLWVGTAWSCTMLLVATTPYNVSLMPSRVIQGHVGPRLTHWSFSPLHESFQGICTLLQYIFISTQTLLWEPRAGVSECGGPTGLDFLHLQLGHHCLPPQHGDLPGWGLFPPACSLHPSPRRDQAEKHPFLHQLSGFT